jgi:hypothetical protein
VLQIRIRDPGSRIPNPYFESLVTIFWGKIFYYSLKIGPIFFRHFKNKNNLQFCEIYGYKKGKTTKTTFCFHPSLLLLFWDPDLRSGNMGKNQNPGSGINIPDPQH